MINETPRSNLKFHRRWIPFPVPYLHVPRESHSSNGCETATQYLTGNRHPIPGIPLTRNNITDWGSILKPYPNPIPPTLRMDLYTLIQYGVRPGNECAIGFRIMFRAEGGRKGDVVEK